MRSIFILLFIVVFLSASAFALMLDDFEYADDAAFQTAYSDTSQSGQSASRTVSTTTYNEGAKSGQIGISHDGTAWASASITHTEASSMDISVYDVVRIDVYGDDGYTGTKNFYIKFFDSVGEKIVASNSTVLGSSGWENLEIALSSFAEDPWDGDPGGGTCDQTQIMGWEFYFEDASGGSPITATVYLDAFEIDNAALPGDGRNANIIINGDFSDWLASDQIDVSPNEVEPAGEGDPDIVDIFVCNGDSDLFISVSFTNAAAGEVDILVDTDMNNGTGLTYGWWASGCDVLCQSTSTTTDAGFFDYGGTGADWTWNWHGAAVLNTDIAWNGGGTRCEVAFDRTWLNNLGDNDQVRVVVGTGSGDWAPTSLGSETYVYTYDGAPVEDWSMY